jgi:hypothetical protein
MVRRIKWPELTAAQYRRLDLVLKIDSGAKVVNYDHNCDEMEPVIRFSDDVEYFLARNGQLV